MIDVRNMALQGIGFTPYSIAVQGVLSTRRRVDEDTATGPDDDPVYDWRYGLHPALRRTGDRLADLRAHLFERTVEPLQGDTELERQEAKLARTFAVATPAGVVDVPVFKPAIRTITPEAIADPEALAAKVAEEVREERRRILLLLSE